MEKYHVAIIDIETNEVIEYITDEPTNFKEAERVERGINNNLNHDKFYVELVKC